jgi:hypothetical protein
MDEEVFLCKECQHVSRGSILAGCSSGIGGLMASKILPFIIFEFQLRCPCKHNRGEYIRDLYRVNKMSNHMNRLNMWEPDGCLDGTLYSNVRCID